MKKITTSILFSTLALLSACGGGGGGSGLSVPSTLPEIVDPASNDGTSITAMSYAVSTEAEATQLIETNLDSNFYSSNGVSTASNSGISVTGTSGSGNCLNKNDCNKKAFNRMKNTLIDKSWTQFQSSSNVDELREALLLVGASLPSGCERNKKNALCTTAGMLSGIDEALFNALKEKAQKIYDNYGAGRVNLENAVLHFNDETDDAYVHFTLDKDNSIKNMIFDYGDGDTETLTRDKKDNTFKGSSKIYEYGIIVGTDCEKGACAKPGHSFVFESGEKLTDIEAIKQGLLKALQKEYDNGELEGLHGGTNNGKFQPGDTEKLFDYTKERIEALTMDDFNRTDMDNKSEDHFYYNEVSIRSVREYDSYAKEMKLAYSDFGTIKFNENFSQSSRPAGNSEDAEMTGVFAGGYEAKKIDPSLITKEMNFKGRAIGSVLYEEEDNFIELANVINEKLPLDGELTLTFKDGQNTLNANFDNWYDVTLTNDTSDSSWDIAFANGERITDEKFKFRKQNTYTVDNMKGKQQIRAEGEVHIVEGQGAENVTGESVGNVRIDYYGDAGNPSEAVGFVGYSESIPFKSSPSVSQEDRIKMLDMEVAFGAKKTDE